MKRSALIGAFIQVPRVKCMNHWASELDKRSDENEIDSGQIL